MALKKRAKCQAIRKATDQARKDMIRVPSQGRTLHHDINGRYGAGRFASQCPSRYRYYRGRADACGFRSAWSAGCCGVDRYIQCAQYGEGDFSGFAFCSPRQIAAKRGKKVGDIVGRRDDGKAKEQGMASKKIVRITQIGSLIRRQKTSGRRLSAWFNKMHRTRELEDTSSVRGMIDKVKHWSGSKTDRDVARRPRRIRNETARIVG